MFNGILHAHSGLRWILLILIVVSIVNAFKKWKAKESFNDLDNKLSLFTLITSHIMMLMGFYLYFVSGKVKLGGLDMKDSMSRFFTVEHITGMLIAIVLITLGRIQSKKITDDTLKHKKIFMMFLFALIIILLAIPWPFRGFGNAWF
jgi:hypothetical protein